MSSPSEEFNWQLFSPEHSIDEQRPPPPSYQQDEIMPSDSDMDTSAALPIEQQKVFPSTSTSMDVSMTWMAKVGSFSGPHKKHYGAKRIRGSIRNGHNARKLDE